MKKILLAEDEDSVRKTLERTLANKYEVLSCENGVKAYYIFKEFKENIGLIITDNEMPRGSPDLGGIRLIKNIRMSFDEPYRGVPIIMLSGDPDVASLALSCGANAFLEKPLSLTDLYSTIERFIT